MTRTARELRDDHAIAKRHGTIHTTTADEDSRAQWARWSEDRTERERAARIEATAQTALDKAITARELADAIADDTAKLVPDWRLRRPDVAGAFMRIVKQQPEYRQKELQQRDSMLRLIADNLPPHIQPLIQDLQTITELIALARESSAYLVGYCTGRKAGGRTRPNRGPLRIGLAEPTGGAK